MSSIGAAAQRMNFGNKHSQKAYDDPMGMNLVGEIDENKKEFNQLKEILREYKPDKQVARANTIKRRQKKMKMNQKVKQQQISDIGKDSPNKRKQRKASQQIEHLPNERTLISKGSEASSHRKESGTSVGNLLQHQKCHFQKYTLSESDTNNSDAKKEVMNKRNISRDGKTKSKQIDIEEDVIYFQYNSDGDANIQIDGQSDANLSQIMPRKSTLKRIKTTLLDQFNGSHQSKESHSKLTTNLSPKLQNSTLQIARTNTNKYEKLIHPSNFQSLNKFLANNPNVHFRVENQSAIRQNSSLTKQISSVSLYNDNYLSPGLPQSSKLTKCESTQNNVSNALDQQQMKNVVVLRSTSNQLSPNQIVTIKRSNQSRILPEYIDQISHQNASPYNFSKQPLQEGYQRKISANTMRIVTFIQENNKVIPEQDEEFGSEVSTPYAKRRKPTITIQKADSMKMKESQISLISSACQQDERDQNSSHVLTLNRYNKIYTQEFNQDDIEIMNINSSLKELNMQLKKITIAQFFLINEIYFGNIDAYQEQSHSRYFKSKEESTNYYEICNIIRGINTLLCASLVALCWRFHMKKAQISRIRKFYPNTLVEGGEQFSVLLSLTTLLIGAKFYILIKIIAYFSPLNSSKGRFIVALRSIDYTNAFLVKVWLTMNPFKGLLLFFCTYILLNAYLLFVVERGAGDQYMRCYYDNGIPITKVVFYKDAVWLTIITFMTVGYGDFSPTTNQGRYIMIITVMGGQMFSALVIGMVHSQLQLTSEEAGVLSIISNNKKERNKRIVAATLIYYLLRIAGAKNTLLQQGNIFWFKTRKVKNLKFELYVEVMKFKKIKSELTTTSASRTQDQNMNIIKNTETQLALLANEVITIFNFVKDAKMERRKNINESYRKWKSKVHEFIDHETILSKQKKVLTQSGPSRTRTQFQFEHKQLSTSNGKQNFSIEVQRSNGEKRGTQGGAGIRASQTMAFLRPIMDNKFSTSSRDDHIMHQLSDEDRASSHNNNKRKESKKISTSNKGKETDEDNYSLSNASINNFKNSSLTEMVQVRNQKEKLQKRLTGFSQQSNTYDNWKNITSKESIEAIQIEESKSPLGEKLKSIQYNYNSPPSNKKKNEYQKSYINFIESQGGGKSLSHEQKKEMYKRHRSSQDSSPIRMLRNLNNKIHYKNQYQKKSYSFAKSQTLNVIVPKNKSNSVGPAQSMGSGTSIYLARLKQQKTCLHPAMNSIVEEQDESFTEDESVTEEDQQIKEDDSDRDDEEEKEDNTSSESASEQSEQEDGYGYEEEQKQDGMQELKIPSHMDYEESSESSNANNRNYGPKKKDFRSSLSEVFDEYQLKKVVDMQMESMKRIYQNQGIQKAAMAQKPKQRQLFSMTNEEDMNEELQGISPSYSRNESQYSSISNAHNKNVNKMNADRTREPSNITDDISILISEDQKTNSNRGTPIKQGSQNDLEAKINKNDSQKIKIKLPFELNQNQLSANHLLVERNGTIKNLSVGAGSGSGSGSGTSHKNIDDINLSPILPFQRKQTLNQFQLKLKQTPIPISIDILSDDHAADDNNQHDFLQIANNIASTFQSLDLTDILERCSSTKSLNIRQRQSLLNFQDQLNQFLIQNKDSVGETALSNSNTISPVSLPSPLQRESNKLKDDMKREQIQIDSLYSKIENTDQTLNKVINEARLKIQKLKLIQPTLQVNVTNNVNNNQQQWISINQK